MRTHATCIECGRRIRLIKKSGRFRRHMWQKSIVCDGSWQRPENQKPKSLELSIALGDTLLADLGVKE